MKKVIEIPKGATIEVKQDRIIIEYEDQKLKGGDFIVFDGPSPTEEKRESFLDELISKL